jgi:hypothetical protein
MKLQINIITWLAYWWFPEVKDSYLAIEQFLLKIELWSITKGDLWVINHLKEIQLLYTRSLCKDPIFKSDRIIGIRKDGLPKGLTFLNNIFSNGTDQDVRFTLTLLSVYRTIKAWKDPDLSTISNSYTGLDFSKHDFDSFIHKFMTDNKISVMNLEWSRKDFYYSIKSGPNGKATWTSIIDAIYLNNDTLKLLGLFSVRLASEIKNWRTFDGLSMINLLNGSSSKSRGLERKLSVVKDPGGKSRIIAILDFWTQNMFRKIHINVFEILKGIKQDRTFTQDPHVDFVGPYYSFDLSAATDRFPIAFQERVMKSLLGSEEKSKAWASVLVDQDFYVPWEDRYIKYNVGQPMGAYSSWAVFALSHHIIVQYAAFLIGEYPTKNYILLGDDIVIGGSLLADTYKVLMESLGVGISFHKTHVSNDTYEFAKRWFRNGIEVSGLQVNAFMETYNAYSLLYQTIRTYYERGLYPKRISSYPELIETLLIKLGYYQRKAENISRKVEVLHGFYRWIHQGDLRSIRDVLIKLCPDEAVIPNEDHSWFKIILLLRFNMAYTVMHAKAVSKVNKYLDNISTVLINDKDIFNPDQIENLDEEIDLDLLLSGEIVLEKSRKLGYSDIYNLPTTLSLNNIAERLSKDERISIDQPDLTQHLDALVIPELDNIRSKVRGANVLIKNSIIAQKILHFHKVLSRGTWMFEQAWISDQGLDPQGKHSSNSDINL